jgi:CRISPR-associated protein Cas1
MPDFREKQVLFVESRVSGGEDLLRFRNSNILLMRDGKVYDQVSCHKALAVFLVGQLSFTSVLVRQCMEHGISVFFLGENLRTYASFGSVAEGNSLLRHKQYYQTPERDLVIAKHLVKNKVRNQIALLKGIEVDKIRATAIDTYEKAAFSSIAAAKNIDSLRGIEGNVTKDFFPLYFGEIGWYRRLPRTKVDENNVLLDMGYTFLFNFVDTFLRLHGFDTYKGVYHQLFFQRKSLACDLEEPFRCIVDRTLRKTHMLKQFDKKDFQHVKGQYLLRYDKQRKYASIFLKDFFRYREDIFSYVKEYYYCVLNDRDDFPFFRIR